MKKLTVFMIFLTIFLFACTSAASGESFLTPLVMTAEVSTVIAEGEGTALPFPIPETPTMIPTLAGGLSTTELKYKVLEQFPDFFFCDPDYYPIAREDETSVAQQTFPDLQANQEEFQAILSHNDLSGVTTFTDEQKLQIYRDHIKLNAIVFEPVDDKYQFQIQTGAEEQSGTIVIGTIDGSGTISVSQRDPAILTCPICLAAGTLIDTPRGPIRVEDLREGDPVWTQDEAGGREIASVLRTGHARVPVTHQMIHILLADGRELWASPGHPTSDGRRLGDLEAGDILDGVPIVQLERLPYRQAYTFDILPSGSTGYYWANGVLLGSTLSNP